MEIFRTLPWPFADDRFPDALGVVALWTCVNGAPVLHVAHGEDGSWMMADGVNDPNEPNAATAACIWHLVGQDETLELLATMPPGTQADRWTPNGPWEFSQFEWEPEPDDDPEPREQPGLMRRLFGR